MARLILVRHGQSIANAERRFTVGPFEPLTRRGREEAIAAALLLRERFDPVALYSSPFVRALETAREIGRLLALEPRVVEDLREQDFGELRGRPYGDYANDPSAQGIGRWQHRPPGGESLLEVAKRAGPAIEALARSHLGQTLVVVSHGGVMASLRGFFAGHFDDAPAPTGNAAGYVVDWDSAGWRTVEVLEITL